MFDYKYPLLEVIQAIEKIRRSQGPTELEVLNYVGRRLRKPNDPIKVLKTIRTLKKLVEDGVLVQKGKRYMFSPNPRESSDRENDNEEVDCEAEEDDEDDMVVDEDNAEEDCEDDDDDDDDEEEDDEEDDDDSSEECDENEGAPQSESRLKEPPTGGDGNAVKTSSKNKNFLCPSKTSQGVSVKMSNATAEVPKGVKSTQDKKSGSGKNVIKGNKANAVIEQKSGDGKAKGGEAIAFCARDFIDSQYRPQSGSSCHTEPSKSTEIPEDSLPTRSEKLELGSIFERNKKVSRVKRSQMSDSNYRSRSPIRGKKPEPCDTLRLDHSGEIGSISSQICQELTDANMEVDGNKDEEGTGVDYDVYRQRSPLGPPPPDTTGADVNKAESCCSNLDNKNQNEIKLEPDFEEYSLKRNVQSQMIQSKCKESHNKWSKEPDKKVDKHKRDLSSDDDKNVSDNGRASLCSVCEKKKRNSR